MALSPIFQFYIMALLRVIGGIRKTRYLKNSTNLPQDGIDEMISYQCIISPSRFVAIAGFHCVLRNILVF
jgi:hypothetical protein